MKKTIVLLSLTFAVLRANTHIPCKPITVQVPQPELVTFHPLTQETQETHNGAMRKIIHDVDNLLKKGAKTLLLVHEVEGQKMWEVTIFEDTIENTKKIMLPANLIQDALKHGYHGIKYISYCYDLQNSRNIVTKTALRTYQHIWEIFFGSTLGACIFGMAGAHYHAYLPNYIVNSHLAPITGAILGVCAALYVKEKTSLKYYSEFNA